MKCYYFDLTQISVVPCAVFQSAISVTIILVISKLATAAQSSAVPTINIVCRNPAERQPAIKHCQDVRNAQTLQGLSQQEARQGTCLVLILTQS